MDASEFGPIVDKWTKIVKDYEKYQTKDTSIPSAPDTSKFMEVHKGNLEIRRRQAFNHIEWDFVIVIGTAIPYKQRTEVFQKALRAAAESGLEHSWVHGTAWWGVGVRC